MALVFSLLLGGCHSVNPLVCPSSLDLEEGLLAEAELSSTNLVVDETYSAVLSLRNESDQPLSFCLSAGPSFGYLRENGRVFPLRLAGFTLDSACAEEVHLPAGDSRTFRVDLAVPEIVIDSTEFVTWYTLTGLPNCPSRKQGSLKLSSSDPIEISRKVPSID